MSRPLEGPDPRQRIRVDGSTPWRGKDADLLEEDSNTEAQPPLGSKALSFKAGMVAGASCAASWVIALLLLRVPIGGEDLPLKYLLAIGIASCLISGSVITIWAKLSIFDPLAELTEALHRITKGSSHDLVIAHKSKTLSPLLDAFGLACERIQGRERQLDRSRKEFHALFEHVPSYIAVIGRDFRIVEMNRNFRDTFGGVEGDHCYRVYKKRSDKCPQCFAEKSFYDGSVHRSEEVGVTKDGEEIPYLVYTAPVVDEWGMVVHVIEMSVELRPLKALEHEKLQAERLAIVGQTVASLAHSIKNILTGLEGGVYVTQIAMKKADQALLQKGWAMVERNIERISHLIRDLLSYSKVGIGTMEPTDLNELVRDAATLYVEMARAAGVELILELDDSLGEVMVDPKALHTCIVNLLSNGLDACREDKEKSSHRVVIGTKRGPAAEVLIQVEDNGVGMDRSTQEKLFQRFFSTKGTRGTGLGLMLTHKLVREHGGRIWAESQPGKGSVFTIAIPQSPSAAYANS